jgi:hypothetical protein
MFIDQHLPFTKSFMIFWAIVASGSFANIRKTTSLEAACHVD